MTITARYPGKCGKCGGRIQVGDQIEWDKATRVTAHAAACTSGEVAEIPTALDESRAGVAAASQSQIALLGKILSWIIGEVQENIDMMDYQTDFHPRLDEMATLRRKILAAAASSAALANEMIQKGKRRHLCPTGGSGDGIEIAIKQLRWILSR